MNAPKKRGRPSKAEIAARNAQVEGEEKVLSVVARLPITSEQIEAAQENRAEMAALIASVHPGPAQAYALRVWNGQSESADRPWRIQRVKEALEGQGLSFEGVVLP